MADNTPTKSAPSPAEAAGSADTPEKSKNADKNEAKRLAKLEKFLAKQQVSFPSPHGISRSQSRREKKSTDTDIAPSL